MLRGGTYCEAKGDEGLIAIEDAPGHWSVDTEATESVLGDSVLNEGCVANFEQG